MYMYIVCGRVFPVTYSPLQAASDPAHTKANVTCACYNYNGTGKNCPHWGVHYKTGFIGLLRMNLSFWIKSQVADGSI